MTIVQQMKQRALEKENALCKILDRPVSSRKEVDEKIGDFVREILTGLGDLAAELYSYVTVEVKREDERWLLTIVNETIDQRKEIVTKTMKMETGGLDPDYDEVETKARHEGLDFNLLIEDTGFAITAKFC